MKNIIIFGAGGHAKVIADIIEKQKVYKLIGFLDDNVTSGTKVYGYEVLGGKEYIAENADILFGGIIALGDNWIRKTVTEVIKELNGNFNFVTAIHPSASIGRGVSIGDGSVVMAGSIINSDAIIGNNCIINTKSSVGHDSVISDYATVAPNATIAGEVKIGECATMSISSTIIQGRSIGKHTVVGAGATVLEDIPDYVTAYGTPAKVIKNRSESDRYLK